MASLECGIAQDEVCKVFKLRWELPGTFKGPAAFRTIGQVDNSAFEAMIMAKEISKNIRGMSKNAMPGPDGLSLRDIIKIDLHFTQLMELFNLSFVPGIVLDMVKECWTVLVSKSSLLERQNDINNW